MASIVIAGAGVMGRLLAWQLARAGHRVSVVDPAEGPAQPGAAGFTAAGMLSPLAEREHAEPEVVELGWRSLQLWPKIAAALGRPELVRTEGSLLVAHGCDLGAALRVLARLQGEPESLNGAALQMLEPALAPELKAWWLPGEGQLLPRELLVALAEQAPDVDWQWGRRAMAVRPHRLELDDGRRLDADLVIDTRGLGAKADMPGLRGDVYKRQIRMRPIIMTTAAMVFGMMPMAIALNDGGEIQAPMGRAIIGGVITSTLLTLVVVPVLYSYLTREKKPAKKAAEQGGATTLPLHGMPGAMPADKE